MSALTLKIAPGAVICSECELIGDITIGARTVIHPKAKIFAKDGPIILGENNLVEEQAQIINSTDQPDNQRSTNQQVMTIGVNNVFEVDSYSKSLKIGDNNVLEAKSKVGRNVFLTNGCVIGAKCDLLNANETIPENTVIYGDLCKRHLQSDRPAPQTLQLDFLTKILPNYHHLKKPTIKRDKTVLRKKSRGVSSTEWLTRHLNDPYVEKARMENYRARSAFKLLEIDNRFHLLSPGHVVLECGAAPGAWTQVITKKINALGIAGKGVQGFAVSLDILPLFPVEGATILTPCDVTNPTTAARLETVLNGRKVDLVLSDIAPNASGYSVLDSDKLVNIAYGTLRLALTFGKTGGHILVKLWDSGAAQKFRTDLLRFYESVKDVKPNSSRTESSEKYLLARNFKGAERNPIAIQFNNK